jgi:hypothetical protein
MHQLGLERVKEAFHDALSSGLARRLMDAVMFVRSSAAL